MPINYSRKLVGRKRNPDINRHLGFLLTLVAGAINAGGFLAVKQYTSHMTGIVSAMADNLALGAYDLVLTGLGALLSFLLGAMCTAFMVNYTKRRTMHSTYALPLLLEASLLLCFGLLGPRLSEIDGLFVSLTVMLLSFIMGLQNALISKLSHGVIRTTHITGIVTDIGIELGKLVYWNCSPFDEDRRVVANRDRLRVLGLLLACFFVGGVAGALGFNRLGYVSTVPLALVLVTLAIAPAADDAIVFFRWRFR
ncbi:YoaK family protein [Propionivibrio limicola]|uniref:YoaK family protein n=1 Tax=Propionivibrio limicola TaxID=167645 RepID=UPI0012918986|nr:YoaK family protein [Propionivibrio limicola]